MKQYLVFGQTKDGITPLQYWGKEDPLFVGGKVATIFFDIKKLNRILKAYIKSEDFREWNAKMKYQVFICRLHSKRIPFEIEKFYWDRKFPYVMFKMKDEKLIRS